MIRKLRPASAGDTNGYAAASLLLVGWNIADDPTTVTARPALVPIDVAPAQFSTAMIDQLLATTPLTYHVTVRERRDNPQFRSLSPTRTPLQTDIMTDALKLIDEHKLEICGDGVASFANLMMLPTIAP